MDIQESVHKEDSSGKGDVKPQRLSLEVLVRRNLPEITTNDDHDKIITDLNKVTHIRLDRENIGEIDNFELLGSSVTNLYLQQNKIKKIEHLEYLQGLQFLVLSNNRIRRVENLMCLPKLGFLDLSENLIERLDIDELPQTLVILNLSENPCTLIQDYRPRIVQDLPKLRQLDNIEVNIQEKRDVGYTISSDEDEDYDTDEEHISNGVQEENTNRYKTLQGVFKDLTSDIILRSQSRLEEVLHEHIIHNAELDDIRSTSAMIPESSRSQLGSRTGSMLSGQHFGSRPPSSVSTSSSHPGSRLGSRGSPLPPISPPIN